MLPKKLYYKLFLLKNSIFPNPVYKAEQENVKQRAGFYKNFVKPGELVFDIGANMGNRVAAFVKLNAKVVAVEPQDDCCLYIREKFGSKVNIEQKGVSDKEGELDFYVADSNILSTFSTERIESLVSGRFSAHKWEKAKKIPITTIDLLIKEYGKPAFVKIDVEGMELQVLKGLTQPVASVSIEYTVPEEVAELGECLAELKRINPRFEYNYSPGESMEFGSVTWMDHETMLEFINSTEFTETSWGDIYTRQQY